MAELESQTVAAVVVTYNRKQLVSQCLDGLLSQTRPLDAIYVIDNASSDGTPDVVGERYAGRVIYERLPENIGSAGGFHHGVRCAYEHGHDWIWCLDDDAVPDSHCLQNLLHHAAPSVSFVAPLIRTAKSGRLQLYHHKCHVNPRRASIITCEELFRSSIPYQTQLEANAFPGVLVSAAALEAAGLPDPSYFILWDDVDFTYRLTKHWRPGLLAVDAVILHHDADPTPPGTFSWKVYYFIRNRIRFYSQYTTPLGQLALLRCNFRTLLRSLMMDSRSRRSIVTAVLDGYRCCFRDRARSQLLVPRKS